MKTLSITLLALVLFAGCKKEKHTEPAENNSSTTSGSGNPDGAPSNATTYNGLLSVRTMATIDVNNNLTVAYTGWPSAGFSSTPIDVLGNPTSVVVDSVVLNNVRLRYDGTTNYEDSTSSTFVSPYVWKVAGKNGIPDISYTNTKAYPTYTGNASLPVKINLNQALNFTLTGLSNNDKIILLIINNTGSGSFFKELASSNTSTVNVSLTATELSALNADPTAIFAIWIMKNNVRTFGGKAFNFSKNDSFT